MNTDKQPDVAVDGEEPVDENDVYADRMPSNDPDASAELPSAAPRGLLARFTEILTLRGPIWTIALGAAIGTFVAWTPTLGLQMSIAVPICLAVGANPLPAIPIIWLTNPLTAVPIYGFNYWVGLKIVGGPPISVFRREFKASLKLLESGETSEAFNHMWTRGFEVAKTLWIGSCVVGLVLAIVVYVVVTRAVATFRRARLARRARRAAARRLAAKNEAKTTAGPV